MQTSSQPEGDWKSQLLWHLRDLGTRVRTQNIDLFNKQYVEGVQAAAKVSDDILREEIEKLTSQTASRSLTEPERNLLDNFLRVRSELQKRIAEKLDGDTEQPASSRSTNKS